MGKATEFDDLMGGMPPRTAEARERRDPRPKLRLRQEVLEQAVTPSHPVADTLSRLVDEPEVALHDPDSGNTAIAVPLDQYLELVTSFIRDRQLAQITADGRAIPSEATLMGLGVEQVDPQATWLHTGGGRIG